jgi:hypothetical protein
MLEIISPTHGAFHVFIASNKKLSQQTFVNVAMQHSFLTAERFSSMFSFAFDQSFGPMFEQFEEAIIPLFEVAEIDFKNDLRKIALAMEGFVFILPEYEQHDFLYAVEKRLVELDHAAEQSQPFFNCLIYLRNHLLFKLRKHLKIYDIEKNLSESGRIYFRGLQNVFDSVYSPQNSRDPKLIYRLDMPCKIAFTNWFSTTSILN